MTPVESEAVFSISYYSRLSQPSLISYLTTKQTKAGRDCTVNYYLEAPTYQKRIIGESK